MKSAVLTNPEPQPEGQSDLFQGLDPKERLDNLEAMAHLVEEDTYFRPLSEDELSERKNDLVDTQVSLKTVQEQKKAATAVFSGQLKDLGQKNQQLVDEIKNKAVEKRGRIFSVLSDDNRWVDKYDADGLWISRRRANAKDSQRHIAMKISE